MEHSFLEPVQIDDRHAYIHDNLVGRMITDVVFNDDTGAIEVRMDNGSFELHGRTLRLVYYPSVLTDLH